MNTNTLALPVSLVALAVAAGSFWNLQQSRNTPGPTPPIASSVTTTAPTTKPNPVSFNAARAKLENERNTIGIVKRDGAGVVFITARAQVNGSGDAPSAGTGSGFVVDAAKGLILTNNHVVTLDSSAVGTLRVRFPGDAKSYAASVVGRSPAYDVALIRVDAPGKSLTALALGDSSAVQVGEKAVAIGNPFGLESSVSEGIVSATGRSFPSDASDASDNLATNVIQTDAAVNPGNSGGPLLDSSGRVIGINTAILSPATGLGGQGQFAGVAFAIPINLVKSLLPELEAGKVLDSSAVLASRPRLGVSFVPLAALPSELRARYKLPDSGVMLTGVQSGSPAAQAGLRGPSSSVRVQGSSLPVGGDVITAINGAPVGDGGALRDAVMNGGTSGAVTLTVIRDGRELTVTVTPGIVKDTLKN